MDNLPDDLIGADEAAKLGKCDPVNVRRWAQRGFIRGWKRAGRWFFSRAEVLAMFEPVKTAPETKAARIAESNSAKVRQAAALDSLRARGFQV